MIFITFAPNLPPHFCLRRRTSWLVITAIDHPDSMTRVLTIFITLKYILFFPYFFSYTILFFLLLSQNVVTSVDPVIRIHFLSTPIRG